MFARPRSKRRAVLLAVFLSFWTWLYTYRRDRFKFWAGLTLATVGCCLPVASLGLVLVTSVWVWAIVDAARKPGAWYWWYPSR